MSDKLEQELAKWEEGVDKSIAKFPERKKAFVTGSKHPVKRL
jgi:hypothetical protein